MPVIRSFLKKIASISLLYAQVLFVFLAFGVMGFASYSLGITIERRHLEQEAVRLSESIENTLIAELRELETTLNIISESIRWKILQGATLDDIKGYMTDITNFGRSEMRVEGFYAVFAIFECFGEEGFTGLMPAFDWANFAFKDRPWYKIAAESYGEIAVTDPYVDVVNGEVTCTYVRNIYDNDGKRLAIICLDVYLDRIYTFPFANTEHENNVWIMLDRNLIVIAHFDPDVVGLPIRDVPGSLSEVAEDLEQGRPVLNRNILSHYGGASRIISFRKIINGWYLGVSTINDYYLRNVSNILRFLLISGLVLASSLSLLLLYINKRKNKANEEARKAIEEKNSLGNLQNIMNSLDILIYVSDPDTNKILFINDKLKDEFQLKGDCVGQLCYKVLQKDIDKRCEFCPCTKLDMEKSNVIIWEEHNTVTNHIYRNVDSLIDWPGGQKVHLQNSIDITELVEAKELAEQNSRYKSGFLANMSHEIRTPMNAILGIAEIQLQDETISRDTQEAFSRIYHSGDLLLNIINDILDLSKIEAGKMELILVKYDIPSLIYDTVQLNKMRYESKPIDFRLQIDKAMPVYLFGDELRIKQILNNLLSNSFKYTAEGWIEFSVSCEPVNVAENETLTLIFRITDTGQGMTEEQIARLFDEYERFNLEANRTSVGAGLGMSITRRLINMMNGEILIESELNKGSVFTVRLPQVCAGTDVCGAELVEKLCKFNFHTSESITKKTQFLREYMPYGSVLVVDDVESNIFVTRGMLLPYGIKVEAASSGFEAIEKIKDGKVYDIVFMDHMMPKMDGIEATKILREMGYKNFIVALTANALIGQADIFLRNGFDAYISKPIDSRELNHILNDLIRDRNPPEVVEAARRDQAEQIKQRQETPGQDVKIAAEKARLFIQDTRKAITVLDSLVNKINELNDEEKELYVITVHGMKSVLYNIGEDTLSKTALKLEMAGGEKNFAEMSKTTPGFINALRSLIVKYEPVVNEGDAASRENEDISEEDAIYLREKMLSIKTACTKFDKNAAKNTLNELKQKVWPGHIHAAMDEISTCLLHSTFAKAVTIAESYIT